MNLYYISFATEAADDCRSYREAHGLLGMNWKQIANVE